MSRKKQISPLLSSPRKIEKYTSGPSSKNNPPTPMSDSGWARNGRSDLFHHATVMQKLGFASHVTQGDYSLKQRSVIFAALSVVLTCAGFSSGGDFRAVPSPRGDLVGLSPPNKAPSSPKPNMQHFISIEFLSNLNVKPPLHTHQAPPHKRKALLLTTFWRRFSFRVRCLLSDVCFRLHVWKMLAATQPWLSG